MLTRQPRLVLVLIALCIAAIGFGAGYVLRGDNGPGPQGPASSQAGHADHAGHADADGQAPQAETVWTCSMHPQIQLPEPGQCPICFMDLIPLVKGGDETETVSLRQIGLSAEARKLAQVTVAPVRRHAVSVETRMAGTVEYDETRLGSITAWMGGRIDKLHVDATGDVVKRGQPMASIYSPELLTAQAELIEADRALKNLDQSSFKLVKDTAQRTKQAAMEKLRLLGLSKRQVERVLERGKPTDHVTLYAPMGGVVIKKDVVEGQYVTTGAPIYRIADLSKVWVVLGAYESDLPWIDVGSQVSFTVESLPGREFTGTVVFVDQVLDEKTRTVDVRLEVDNPGYKLKPGMLANGMLQEATQHGEDAGGEAPLIIPASAPLVTGKRAVVYVALPEREGVYEGREVVLGPRAGDSYIVREGLSEGDMVVVQGNFKIDSALQIMAKPSMMNPSVIATSGGGHQHGGMPMATAESPEPAYDLPVSMAYPVSQAAGAFDALTRAVESGGLEQARQAFGAFYDRMCAIDPTKLEGEAALHWRELSMLLKNDGILGREARDMRRMKQIHAEAWTHFKRLSETFPVGGGAAKRFDVPDGFRQQLADVFASYTDVSESLAGDDAEGAKSAAEEMKTRLSMVNMLFLDGEAHAAWMELKPLMDKALDDIQAAGDIVAMRTAFEPLSLGMIDAATRYGLPPDTPAFVLSCPMAFENKGATWLQSDEAIRNPYFGAAMYRCGEVLHPVEPVEQAQ